MKIGILGCGAIASIIVNELFNDPNIQIKYFYDLDIDKAKRIAKINNGIATNNFDELIENSDLILESASPRAVGEFGKKILEKGKDILIMSIGYLMDENKRFELEKIAKENGAKIYLPSGAIIGLDGLKAASIGKITNIILTTKKSPKSIDTDGKKQIIFDGKASEAIKKFPKNINVAVALSIAAKKDIDVKIIVDPEIDKNIHEVYVEGEFGSFKTITKNVPSKINPKTSILAAFSAINLLKSMNETIQF
ncbi:MAG: aspartate dehydrogenase [Methanobrevibacter sp.]|jgi:aspartate dehydrogenase|nr:aspartate dehydrogenase [Candidatus Methanoflexus mossambicus]